MTPLHYLFGSNQIVLDIIWIVINTEKLRKCAKNHPYTNQTNHIYKFWPGKRKENVKVKTCYTIYYHKQCSASPKSFVIMQRDLRYTMAQVWQCHPSPRIITHRRIVVHGRQINQLDVFVAFITKQQTSNQVQEVTLHTSSPTPIPLMYILQRLCITQFDSNIEVALIIILQCLLTNIRILLTISSTPSAWDTLFGWLNMIPSMGICSK